MEQMINRVPIGMVSDFPDRLGKRITVGTKEIAVFKLSNGRIKAIENKCPHKGGVLSDGMVSGEHVFCPMHDWKINVADGKVQAPDEGCVQTYKTEVENEQVYIFVEN